MSSLNLRSIATRCTLLFSLLFTVKFWYLGGGDVVSYYPYISPDGFDWYLEGAYLIKSLAGANLPALPVLRPPVFVLVTAADFIFGGGGLILGAIGGLTIFGAYYFVVKIIDTFFTEDGGDSWCAIPIAIGSCIYPLNFIKPFILADSLAMTLSLASVFALVRCYQKWQVRVLISSTILAALAGLTQTYALIPFLLASSLAIFYSFFDAKKRILEYFLALVSASAFFLLVTVAWRINIPHITTPENFTLLKLSGNMFNFYIKTWSFYFLPLILFFVFSKSYEVTCDFKKYVSAMSATLAAIFGLLCFFYQWPEARFTYYMWPWLMIFFFSSVRPQKKSGSKLIIVLMLILVVLVPTNYWEPSWDSIQPKLVRNWVGNYFTAVRVDRKFDLCGDDCVGKNDFLQNSDPYVNSTVKLYQQIKDL